MSSPQDPFPIRRLSQDEVPMLLREISDPPERLTLRGRLPEQGRRTLAVVGSRRHTAYGKDAVETLISGLRGHPVTIVSGLALGIDAIAHESALRAGLTTIAVPGSGLSWDVLYPRSHVGLARRILEAGGSLLSEFPEDTPAAPWTFPKRNRIMAGLSHAVLVIEAVELSGTLITARLATEENRDVLAVPGPITSLSSRGPNMLIRDGATPILSATDLLDALGMTHATDAAELLLSDDERSLFDAIVQPLHRDELFAIVAMPPERGNAVLLELEMKGLVRSHGGMVLRA